MAKDQRKREIEDEPGAEERFKRGIERALNTPPKSHKKVVNERRQSDKKKPAKSAE